MKRIKTKSGLDGWQCRLQENYVNSGEFAAYSDMYGIATKLGFADAMSAWHANPIVQGSVNPDDYCIVHEGGGKRTVKVIVEIEINKEPGNVADVADWQYRNEAEDAIQDAWDCATHYSRMGQLFNRLVSVEAAANEVEIVQ